MNIRSFQYFITIWEKPTLSAAADALYISQPALSQQIKKIEEEVGAQLFTRKGHTMSLTPAGEVFLLCSRRILQFYEAMQREVKMLSVFLCLAIIAISHRSLPLRFLSLLMW